MTSAGRVRAMLLVALIAHLVGLALLVISAFGPHPLESRSDAAVSLVALTPSVLLGLLVARRRPDSPAGPALVALSAAPSLTRQLEEWGASFGSAYPWPGADAVARVSPGLWVFNLAGFVLLCLTFPGGRLPGRRWRAMPWLFLLVAVLVDAVVSLDPVQFESGGGVLPGASPLRLTVPPGSRSTSWVACCCWRCSASR